MLLFEYIFMRKLLLIYICLVLTACNSKTPNINNCVSKYNDSELSFFAEVGFGYNNKTRRWSDNLLISVEGAPETGDIEVLDTIIEELRPLIFPLQIKRVQNNGNVKVRFSPTFKDKPKHMLGCLDYRIKFFTNYFKIATIWVNSRSKGKLRQGTLRHEFMHALGFNHPKSRFTGTIIESLVEYESIDDFEAGNTKLFHFSELDKTCIRILYDLDMPVGLTKEIYLETISNFKRDSD